MEIGDNPVATQKLPAQSTVSLAYLVIHAYKLKSISVAIVR